MRRRHARVVRAGAVRSCPRKNGVAHFDGGEQNWRQGCPCRRTAEACKSASNCAAQQIEQAQSANRPYVTDKRRLAGTQPFLLVLDSERDVNNANSRWRPSLSCLLRCQPAHRYVVRPPALQDHLSCPLVPLVLVERKQGTTAPPVPATACPDLESTARAMSASNSPLCERIGAAGAVQTCKMSTGGGQATFGTDHDASSRSAGVLHALDPL